ncbi:MAG TPA: hypothetical protein VGF30_11450 [Bacteroidia bacterium]
MKKTFILLSVTVASLAFVSCKKDYACTCTSTTTYSNGDTDGNTPTVTTIKEVKKSQAQSLCADTERTGSSSFGGSSVTYTVTSDCTLAKK